MRVAYPLGNCAARGSRAQLTVIDVRTADEYNSGHIQGSTNVPLGELVKRISEVVPDKHAPVAVHCRSGRRSATAKVLLNEQGYTEVKDLGSLEHAREVVEAK